jgi:alkylation response protein AidB-like acyl-CoA dehydrogenase
VPFDFTLDARVLDWQQRIRAFVAEVAIPLEQQAFADGIDDKMRRELQAGAKAAGIWAPQLPADLGGGGFRFDDVAVLLEEAGTSLLGALAINAAAPDEGNLHMLNAIASPQQRTRFLEPLAAGDVRSAFAMTEPAPGAGSDPAALRTTVTKVSDGWRIDGHKHFISGADGAAFFIVMAAGGSDDGTGATMLLVDSDAPGLAVGEHNHTIDGAFVGGHCHVNLDGVVVGDDAVLGEPGKGFRYAQVRLAPARMTHCMRWLGAARRAHEIALGRAVDRELFGSNLAALGMAQAMIAENEIDIAAARSMLWHTCWQLATGSRGTEESSRAKVFISEATGRIVDRSVQLAGGLGMTDDLVIGRIYADIRAFRIYDGATEVHKMSIAKRAAQRASSS